jgi:glycerophosphoryl diester phosphodiesterase
MPSSTLAAMERAIGLGLDGLELDVHATADRSVVCCHDATVDRTTDGHGRISSLTLAELQSLDPCHYFVPGLGEDPSRPESEYPFRGRARDDSRWRIPTLDEVLDSFPDVFINLDIKETSPEVEPFEELLASVLAAHGRQDDVIVASFHGPALERFNAVAPDTPLAAPPGLVAEIWQASRLGGPPPSKPYHSVVALQVPTEFAGVRVVDRQFVDFVHRMGLALHVWTVDEASEMVELIDLGVDGLMTDRPSVAVEAIDPLGVRWR